MKKFIILLVIAITFFSIGCIDTSENEIEEEIIIETDSMDLIFLHDNANIYIYYQPATTNLIYKYSNYKAGGVSVIQMSDLTLEQRIYLNDRYDLDLPNELITEEQE